MEYNLLNSVTSFKMVLEVQSGCNKNILTTVWGGQHSFTCEDLSHQNNFTKGTCTQRKKWIPDKMDSPQFYEPTISFPTTLTGTLYRSTHAYMHSTPPPPSIHTHNQTTHTNMYMLAHTNTYITMYVYARYMYT